MVLVVFKSDKKYFDKEKADLKNWTIREIDEADMRFLTIRTFAEGKLRKLHIDIICNETQEKFRRKIRDVAYIVIGGVSFVGLTWDEKEVGG